MIRFVSDRVDEQVISGTLTVRDVTRPVILSIEQSAQTANYRIGAISQRVTVVSPSTR